MKPDHECKYPGCGRIWRKNGRWYWETSTGKCGGPTKSRDCAQHSMETNWRTDMREQAGLGMHSDGARYPMPDAERLDTKHRRYDASLVSTWQEARILVCRRWGV